MTLDTLAGVDAHSSASPELQWSNQTESGAENSGSESCGRIIIWDHWSVDSVSAGVNGSPAEAGMHGNRGVILPIERSFRSLDHSDFETARPHVSKIGFLRVKTSFSFQNVDLRRFVSVWKPEVMIRTHSETVLLLSTCYFCYLLLAIFPQNIFLKRLNPFIGGALKQTFQKSFFGGNIK